MTWQSLKDTNKKQSEDILVVSKRLNNLEEAEKGYRKYIPIAESNVKRIEVLECDNKRIEISLAKIESHLAGIETNILWLKDSIIDKNK